MLVVLALRKEGDENHVWRITQGGLGLHVAPNMVSRLESAAKSTKVHEHAIKGQKGIMKQMGQRRVELGQG